MASLVATSTNAPRPVTHKSRLASVDTNGIGATDISPVSDGSRHERPRNRIQVSREKRPLSFFVGLAKKFLLTENEVELSGLGLAVTTVVTVAEILKSSGHVEITRIQTSLVDMKSDVRSSTPKAKIQIWIKKGDSWPEIFADMHVDAEMVGPHDHADDDLNVPASNRTDY